MAFCQNKFLTQCLVFFLLYFSWMTFTEMINIILRYVTFLRETDFQAEGNTRSGSYLSWQPPQHIAFVQLSTTVLFFRLLPFLITLIHIISSLILKASGIYLCMGVLSVSSHFAAQSHPWVQGRRNGFGIGAAKINFFTLSYKTDTIFYIGISLISKYQ